MILKESFSIDHINRMKDRYPTLDKKLIERTIFAFGLLESLAKVKMPFIFKGGTALMLLLKRPYRLSTDIDIIVEPSCEVDDYLTKAAVIYPFLRVEEHIRVGKNDIVKKHYKYYYKSPTSEKEIPILLDILFEHHGYEKLATKEIANEFLLTSGGNYQVQLPTIESILGDKLTAFAPHTTGIEYEYVNDKGTRIEKTLEVIKQFLDVSQLILEVKNPESVRNTYNNVIKSEIKYRGIDVTSNDCLKDTFKATLSILSRGALYTDDYPYLITGIRKIQNHIFGFSVNGEVAYKFAAPVLLFVAKMINHTYDVLVMPQPPFTEKNYRAINQIRKLDQSAFDMIATAIRMVDLN
ncbi:MAG: nucleotidyl transferase AbiEii/AbiGii toxin family protein [Candidatus Izemoplasmatales bacterium]|nr:nucleotidyl transferase AbiEii/AbiGii toxin family protein [Candidatus Izemoplasmatales bacterium]